MFIPLNSFTAVDPFNNKHIHVMAVEPAVVLIQVGGVELGEFDVADGVDAADAANAALFASRGPKSAITVGVANAPSSLHEQLAKLVGQVAGVID